jgi:hypothetical protein
MLFAQDAPDWKKLRTLAGRDGDLRLSHFRRVKQLGSGDVGLVDLVQIQVLLRKMLLQPKDFTSTGTDGPLRGVLAVNRHPVTDSGGRGRCLQGDAETRFAMKTLEKREMVERNKVLSQLHCQCHDGYSCCCVCTLFGIGPLTLCR